MKHIIEYVEECGEGYATPGNTIGMGNPMPPTENQPGTEPIVHIAGPKQEKKETSKRKKKKVTESILDNDLEKGLDEKIISDWFSKHSSSKIKIGKDLKISSGYLTIYLDETESEIPSWIQFDNVKTFNLVMDFDKKSDLKEYTVSNIPSNCENFNIECHGVKRLIIDIPSLIVKQRIVISGMGTTTTLTELVLPDKIQCSNMDLTGCSLLSLLKFKKLDINLINLPKHYVDCVLKKEFGVKNNSIAFAIQCNALF